MGTKTEAGSGTRDETRMAAWRALLQAHSALVSVLGSELEAETGMPLNQYDVLVQLSGAPEGRMRMQDLADSVLLSKSGVTRLIDRMVEAGLVGREACSSDRRVTYAVLTREGRRRLDEASVVHMRGVEEHFARHVGQEEAAVIAAALMNIARNVSSDGSGGLAPECTA